MQNKSSEDSTVLVIDFMAFIQGVIGYIVQFR